MRFSGKVEHIGKYWAIEVPILGIATQGRSKKDAFIMMADAVETLVNKKGFSVDIYPGKGDYFEIGSGDEATLAAFLLKRERLKSGLSLAEVAARLGIRSINGYARYEQGRSMPSFKQLGKIFSALTPTHDFVISESM